MPDIFDSQQQKSTGSSQVNPEAMNDEAPGATSSTEPNPNSDEFDAYQARRSGRRDVNEYSMVMRQEEPTKNPFQSFIAKPESIFFDSQHHEEKVLLVLRRHPITQLGWVLLTILAIFAPLLFEPLGINRVLPPRFESAIYIGWYLLILGFTLESFLTWFFNVYIVTDERIIDVDFYNLIQKNISAAKIDNIEDISAEAGGVLASLFDYGTVKIQTAAAVTEFDFSDVPHPAKVTAFLNELLVEEEREKLENRVN